MKSSKKITNWAAKNIQQQETEGESLLLCKNIHLFRFRGGLGVDALSFYEKAGEIR